MADKLYQKGLSPIKLGITIALCLFSIASIFLSMAQGDEIFNIFYCLATIPFAAMPLLLSLMFKWRINTAAYTVFSLYTMGPLLGAVYKLYYVTSWWDDLLHLLAGILFAVCGTYIAIMLNKKNKTSYGLAALFGFCFSLAIAILWELFEFGSDMLLGSDMQADTIVNSIATKLGTTDGSLTVFEGITEVTVNGQPLGLGGYLDIGLRDTMHDTIMEVIGALIYMVYALIDKDRHPMIVSWRKES